MGGCRDDTEYLGRQLAPEQLCTAGRRSQQEVGLQHAVESRRRILNGVSLHTVTWRGTAAAAAAAAEEETWTWGRPHWA
jgi:hypothetical protein